MRKILCMILGLVMMLSVAAGALAEGTEEGKPAEGWLYDSLYGTTWDCEQASASFYSDEGDPEIRLTVIWGKDSEEFREYLYMGRYDAENDAFKAGRLYVTDVKMLEDGSEGRTPVSEQEIEAVAQVNEEGKLTVTNPGDQQLEGLAFDRVDPELTEHIALPREGWLYDSMNGTTWKNDSFTISFAFDEFNLWAYVTSGDGPGTYMEWQYAGRYDEADGSFRALFLNCDEVTKDATGLQYREAVGEKTVSTVFSLDSTGRLVITDAEVEQLEGLTFTRVGY